MSAVSVQAGIVAVDPGIALLTTPPTSVADGALESDTTIFAFQERQNYVLPVPIRVDITRSGLVNDPALLSPGFLAKGWTINTYYLSFDPVGTPTVDMPYSGWIVFGEPVIGIAVQAFNLNGSNSTGSPTTTYPPYPPFNNGIGLTATEGIYLSPDRLTLHLAGAAKKGVDQIRVFTSPIPEPGSILLISAGLACFFLLRGFASQAAAGKNG